MSFQCQRLVEDLEDDLMELLPDPEVDASLREQVCVKRSSVCKAVRQRDEL